MKYGIDVTASLLVAASMLAHTKLKEKFRN